MTAAGLIPFMISIGVAVDMSRLGMAKAVLQAAADEAALAGASAYQTSGQVVTAQTVATSYFNRAIGLQAALVVAPSVTVTAAPGQFQANVPSNNVTVTATARLQTTFLSFAKIDAVNLRASATAANPWGSQVMQPVISSGFLGSSAGDWNSVWMYAVPLVVGVPNFNLYPPFNQFYEIASNCSAATNSNWQPTSQCNGWQGAVVPSTQAFPPVAANQPLAFVMFNMTSGEFPHGQGYSSNQYGSANGDMRLQVTAALALGFGPAALDDTARVWIDLFFNGLLGSPNLTRGTDAITHYSDVNLSSTPNCGLIIQVVDPAHPPTLPPLPSGYCYSLSDQRAGLQYANLSCAQMNGRTFIYWWNDMGGNPDDKDYNDMWFSIRCVPTPSNTNGGYLYSGPAPAANLSTALIQ